MTDKYPIYFCTSRAGVHVYVDVSLDELVRLERRNYFMFPGTPKELADTILDHTEVLWVTRGTGATTGKTVRIGA